MKERNSLFSCLLILISIFSIQAQVKLEYQLKPGDTFKVHQIANQDIIQTMNGSEHKMQNTIEADYIFIVKNVSDSLYTIDFKFESFKMVSSSNMMGEIMSVNTKDSIAEDDIEAKLFSGLTKSFLTMEMYKTGKLKNVTGSKELVEKMVSGSGDYDDFTKEMMKAAMEKEFGDESLGQSFEQMTYLFPVKNPVNVNESWTNNFEGDLSAQNTWTLVSNTKDAIELSAKSDIVFKNVEDNVTMNLTGTMDSKVIIDPTTKFITIMNTVSTAEGMSKLKQMNDLEVPTTIISKITYKAEKNVQ